MAKNKPLSLSDLINLFDEIETFHKIEDMRDRYYRSFNIVSSGIYADRKGDIDCYLPNNLLTYKSKIKSDRFMEGNFYIPFLVDISTLPYTITTISMMGVTPRIKSFYPNGKRNPRNNVLPPFYDFNPLI